MNLASCGRRFPAIRSIGGTETAAKPALPEKTMGRGIYVGTHKQEEDEE